MPEVQTITRTVYTYDELSDSAKERVAVWLNDNPDQSAIEFLIDPETAEYPKWLLPTFHDVQLYGGGKRREVDHYASWEPGDYHLSIGYVIDLPLFMRSHKIAGKYRAAYNAAVEGLITARITNGPNRYYGRHPQFDILEIDTDYHPDPDRQPIADQIDRLREMLEEMKDARIEELSGYLRAESEYQWSEEYLVDTCEANEYRFLENGAPA